MQHLDAEGVRPPVTVRGSARAAEWAFACAFVVSLCVHACLRSCSVVFFGVVVCRFAAGASALGRALAVLVREFFDQLTVLRWPTGRHGLAVSEVWLSASGLWADLVGCFAMGDSLGSDSTTGKAVWSGSKLRWINDQV